MNNDINKTFGKRVVQLRKLQGLSQEELSFRCDIHRTYMGALERGEKSPTLNTLQKLAHGLNLTIKELFDYDAE